MTKARVAVKFFLVVFRRTSIGTTNPHDGFDARVETSSNVGIPIVTDHDGIAERIEIHLASEIIVNLHVRFLPRMITGYDDQIEKRRRSGALYFFRLNDRVSIGQKAQVVFFAELDEHLGDGVGNFQAI